MLSGMRILVVEDDLATRKMLRFLLEQSGGCTVEEAASATEAFEHFEYGTFDLVILDIRMPGPDGFDLCKHIRTTSNVPLMIVSAVGDTAARIRGLQLGADEFLPKPFDPSELLARVEAVLRRAWRAPRVSPDGQLRVGRLTLHLAQHEVELRSERGGARVAQLTPTEFKLLLVLARSPGRAIPRQELQEALWGPNAGETDSAYKTLNAYMAELRSRLEPNAAEPRLLQTVRGVGYRLDPS
jgi:DNA-binding response OmpR family regulator